MTRVVVSERALLQKTDFGMVVTNSPGNAVHVQHSEIIKLVEPVVRLCPPVCERWHFWHCHVRHPGLPRLLPKAWMQEQNVVL